MAFGILEALCDDEWAFLKNGTQMCQLCALQPPSLTHCQLKPLYSLYVHCTVLLLYVASNRKPFQICGFLSTNCLPHTNQPDAVVLVVIYNSNASAIVDIISSVCTELCTGWLRRNANFKPTYICLYTSKKGIRWFWHHIVKKCDFEGENFWQIHSHSTLNVPAKSSLYPVVASENESPISNLTPQLTLY